MLTNWEKHDIIYVRRDIITNRRNSRGKICFINTETEIHAFYRFWGKRYLYSLQETCFSDVLRVNRFIEGVHALF